MDRLACLELILRLCLAVPHVKHNVMSGLGCMVRQACARAHCLARVEPLVAAVPGREAADR